MSRFGASLTRTVSRASARSSVDSSLALTVAASVILGFGARIVINSGFGTGPWDVTTTGVADRFDVPISVASWAVSLVFVLAAIALKVRPTIHHGATLLVTGLSLEATAAIVAEPEGWASALAWAIGVTIIFVAVSIFSHVGTGGGSLELLAAALLGRFGMPLAATRWIADTSLLVSGVILGGRFGPGTVLSVVVGAPMLRWMMTHIGHYDAGRCGDGLRPIKRVSA